MEFDESYFKGLICNIIIETCLNCTSELTNFTSNLIRAKFSCYIILKTRQAWSLLFYARTVDILSYFNRISHCFKKSTSLWLIFYQCKTITCCGSAYCVDITRNYY